MSDIIKSNFISFSDQKRQIKTVDKNDPKVLKSTLESKDNKNNRKSTSHESLTLDDLGIDANQSNNQTMTKKISNGQIKVDKPVESKELPAEIHQAQDESISLTDEDWIEIEKLKEEAKSQGYEEGLVSGKTDGYNQGYEEGKSQAEIDVNKALETYSKEQESIIEKLKNELIEEYSGYIQALEPKMLAVIEDLVVKIIGVQEISKATIMHLIKCGLNELELHGDLIIKVSSKDLDYVIERKNELTEELSEKIKVEILKDQQLEENECVIETEMGTIDCSLGTQLEGLLKELRLIKDSLLVD